MWKTEALLALDPAGRDPKMVGELLLGDPPLTVRIGLIRAACPTWRAICAACSARAADTIRASLPAASARGGVIAIA
jgi:hypothetical protein